MLRKAVLFILTLGLFLSYNAKGQIMTYFTHNVFSFPGEGPYIEMYLRIPATTLKPMKTDTGYTVSVKISLAVFKGDNAVYFDKYILVSPATEDSLMMNFDLLDLKRTKIDIGTYEISLQVTDMNDSISSASLLKEVTVQVPENMVSLSNIILLDSIYPSTKQTMFTRYNYELIPAVLSIYSSDRDKLLFYIEAYNTDKANSDRYMFKYYLKDTANNIVESTLRSRTRIPEKLIYNFDGIPLNELGSGKYQLYVDLLNYKNELIAREKTTFYFYRIKEYALAEGPATYEQVIEGSEFYDIIFSGDEQEKYNELVNAGDTVALKMWFEDFWKAKDEQNPWMAYQKFRAAVEYTNEHFSAPAAKGYHSDRGRIYILYGKPDFISPFPEEQNAYEYEIWQYYQAKNQRNVRFVFFNPTQVPNDFTLLHSDMYGELSNPRWKEYIYSRVSKSRSIEDNSSPNIIGTQLDRRFEE